VNALTQVELVELGGYQLGEGSGCEPWPCEGWLNRDQLRALPEDAALAQLRSLPGIGEFSRRGSSTAAPAASTRSPTMGSSDSQSPRPARLSGWPWKFVGGCHAASGSGLSWGSSCCSWRLMRSMRPCRSLAVNSQLNGLAVWLYRSTKPSRVAESCPRLAKSLGVTTFFWMTEKKISINRPSGVSAAMSGFRLFG
jgi:hypothetical protein